MMPPRRPNLESFAMAMASSSLSKPITTPSGPKTSSCANGERLSTSSKSVGSWKKPRVRWAGRLPPATSVAQEEVFGPLGVVIGFDNDDEAIAIANDSKFGLRGGIISADVGRSEERR